MSTFFKIHYPGVPESLTLSKPPPTLSLNEHRARMYHARFLFRDAAARLGGLCDCGRAVRRAYADFDPLTGRFRGALCRECSERAKLCQVDADGRVVWAATAEWAQMVAGWTYDFCRFFLTEHHDRPADRPCHQCGTIGDRWCILANYLLRAAGEEPTFNRHTRLHLSDNEKGAEPAGPTPLFLAPAVD